MPRAMTFISETTASIAASTASRSFAPPEWRNTPTWASACVRLASSLEPAWLAGSASVVASTPVGVERASALHEPTATTPTAATMSERSMLGRSASQPGPCPPARAMPPARSGDVVAVILALSGRIGVAMLAARHLGWGLLFAWGLACSNPPVFACQEDDACGPGGTCNAMFGYCTFPSDDCESGQRFG